MLLTNLLLMQRWVTYVKLDSIASYQRKFRDVSGLVYNFSDYITLNRPVVSQLPYLVRGPTFQKYYPKSILFHVVSLLRHYLFYFNHVS